MTEKQETLAFVIDHFMNKAEKYRKSGDGQKVVNAGQWDAAAIEVAGLGTSQDTIGKAVAKYVNFITIPFLHFEYMHSAVRMAQKGAHIDVVEWLIKILIKNNYCWIWALRDLTILAGRKPNRVEIFALVNMERANNSSLSKSLHKELIELAKEYLSCQDVLEVKSLLKEKITEWKSHPFD